MNWLYTSVYNALADFFTMMTELGANLFDLSWVQAALKFFSLFGWGLFIAGLAVAIFDIAIEYQSMGRINIKRQILPFLYGLLAVNLFTVVPVQLFRFAVNLQNTFAKDLVGEVVGMNVNFDLLSHQALTIIGVPGISTKNSLLALLMLICLGYCVIKCFFSNIKRGGILLTQIAVGSLHMFSLPRGYSEGFTGWCKQIIAICFTAFMQTTLLLLGMITMQTHALLGLGVMLAANEVPRIAQQFGLDTSMRVNMMSAVHSFALCYYYIPLEFDGQIEKITNRAICFKRIFVSGMYDDGMCFDGKEDHVWMPKEGFEDYKVGDCLTFFAEVYRYVKTGNGKRIDFALRNPKGIKKIDSYELPTDDELMLQSIDAIICETCYLNEHCSGYCVLSKQKKGLRQSMLDILKSDGEK